MKARALALPGWFAEECSLCRYLMSPHAGHAYPEDVIDGVSLIASWSLFFAAILSAMTVLAAGLLG